MKVVWLAGLLMRVGIHERGEGGVGSLTVWMLSTPAAAAGAAGFFLVACLYLAIKVRYKRRCKVDYASP